tara:strand:- start:562 stop:906 length:345 start_codon:yes stop_codon:yes gene_type:complete
MCNNYITFYLWDPTVHAINPGHQESLPVDGLIYIERTSSTQIKLHYGLVTVELTHTNDPAYRVVNGFKKAVNLARTSGKSTAVSFDVEVSDNSIVIPIPTPPDLYVSNVSVKKL